MIKKLFLVLLFITATTTVYADQYYDGNVCRDYVNIFIDTTQSDGSIEVYYTDCDGVYHEDNFACEALNICVDTKYPVHLGAYADNNFMFESWSNNNIIDSNSTSFSPCHDTTIEPIFRRYDHQDDDSGCFIRTVK